MPGTFIPSNKTLADFISTFCPLPWPDLCWSYLKSTNKVHSNSANCFCTRIYKIANFAMINIKKTIFLEPQTLVAVFLSGGGGGWPGHTTVHPRAPSQTFSRSSNITWNLMFIHLESIIIPASFSRRNIFEKIETLSCVLRNLLVTVYFQHLLRANTIW